MPINLEDLSMEGTHMRLSSHLVFGICAIGFGILLTLGNLHIMELGNVWRFWPAILIIVGIAEILGSCCTSGIVIGVIVGGFGTLLLLDNLNLISFYAWDLWPLAIVAVGASIVWRAFDRGHASSSESSNVVNGFALLSGVVRKCDSQSFRGGELTAIMGGCEVDLRQASVDLNDAVIHVFALMGGIEIKVPEDWRVKSEVFPLMGGFDDKTREPREGSVKTLVLKGIAVFGGVEVKN